VQRIQQNTGFFVKRQPTVIKIGDKNKINADKLVKSCKSCVYFFVGKLMNTVERFRDS
jgi:hypothetical protein